MDEISHFLGNSCAGISIPSNLNQIVAVVVEHDARPIPVPCHIEFRNSVSGNHFGVEES